MVSDRCAVNDREGPLLISSPASSAEPRIVVCALMCNIPSEGGRVRNHHPVRMVGIVRWVADATQGDQVIRVVRVVEQGRENTQQTIVGKLCAEYQ